VLDYEKVDFYVETDPEFLADTHGYFEYLRGKGPVARLPNRNTVVVTGFEEAVQVMLDPDHFSSFTTITGPMTQLPFEPEGDDITDQLEAARAGAPLSNHVLTTDGDRHSDLRSILAVLFTPSRMKRIEPLLRQTADALIDEFAADGKVDLVRQFGAPYAALVIADLFGLSESSRQNIRRLAASAADPASGKSAEETMQDSFVALGKAMFRLIATSRLKHSAPVRLARRMLGMETRLDILGELATARFPNGATPSLGDVAILATVLFGAGQDTANRLLANSMKLLAARPDLQDELRANPGRIPDFIEEMLRYEGSVKSASRICSRTTTLGGMEIKAGTNITIAHIAANRDPRRFMNPMEFDMDRKRAKEHIGFGRGTHTCPGAQLARAEVRIGLERLLQRLGNIRLSEQHHGPQEARRFKYDASYLLMALSNLHLEFDPLS